MGKKENRQLEILRYIYEEVEKEAIHLQSEK